MELSAVPPPPSVRRWPAANNAALGTVGQQLLFGTTLYLNQRRSVRAATVATGDFFSVSETEDSDTKVANILNLEGGMGADLLGGGTSNHEAPSAVSLKAFVVGSVRSSRRPRYRLVLAEDQAQGLGSMSA